MENVFFMINLTYCFCKSQGAAPPKAQKTQSLPVFYSLFYCINKNGQKGQKLQVEKCGFCGN
jgi:hypothetical protein